MQGYFNTMVMKRHDCFNGTRRGHMSSYQWFVFIRAGICASATAMLWVASTNSEKSRMASTLIENSVWTYQNSRLIIPILTIIAVIARDS